MIVEDDGNFRINWKDIYAINKDIKNRMIHGKKLRKKEKLELVTRVVQQVRDTGPHATRTIFDQASRQLHKKYPITFKSELANGNVAKKTLGFKMKTKFDNDLRPARKTTTEKQAPACKAAYGCLRWRVVDLPDSETEESLEEKRIALEVYFESHRPNAWDWEYIGSAMDKLFGRQRADINRQAEEILKTKTKEKARKRQNKQQGNKQTDQEQQVEEQQVEEPAVVVTTTTELRNQWPFLFVPSGMLMHFYKLTDINLEEKWEAFIENRLDKLIEFMLATNKDRKKKGIKKRMDAATETLSEDSSIPSFAALMLLLIQRFEEQKDAMWLMVDVSFFLLF